MEEKQAIPNERDADQQRERSYVNSCFAARFSPLLLLRMTSGPGYP